METVLDSVNLEMNTLEQYLQLLPSEVTDDLVEIKLSDFVNTVSSAAPVLWKLLHHAVRPSDGTKDPNAVRLLLSTWHKPMFKGISQVVLMKRDKKPALVRMQGRSECDKSGQKCDKARTYPVKGQAMRKRERERRRIWKRN
jgi:hypothetical protein